MANNENINKVIYGTSTLIDLTEDTVSADRMYKGDIAHAADGSEIVGTAEVTVEDTCLIMPEGLVTPIGTVDPDTYEWIRPDYLPDLDSIYNDETNTIYMTIDATGRIPDPHLNIYFTASGGYTVEIGSIQNGIFVVDETINKASSNYFTKVWEPTPGLYPVVKLSASKNVTSFRFNTWTSDNNRIYHAQHQPIIEWIGHVYQIDGNCRTSYYTEREKIKVEKCSTTGLQNRWYSAYSLQDLDVSDWDTSTWALTNLASTWSSCYSLVKLDLDNWDTSNWAVTNLSNTFYYCPSLEILKCNEWDTSNWKVTTLSGTWTYCTNIRSLDLSKWDTSEWSVTNLSTTWSTCISLEYLNISSWDTSKWNVPALSSTWYLCYRLKELNLSNWDTTNWTVNTLSGTWNSCYQLKHLDLSGWNTSNWVVTTMANTWDACYNLIDIKGIENFNTSIWPLTTMRYAWRNCFCLKDLDLSNWDTTSWVLTTYGLEGTWNTCKSLEILDLNDWNTTNWTINTLSATWNHCEKLKILNIDNWDTSNWEITTISSMMAWCTSLKRFPCENWNTSNWEVTTLQSAFQYLYVIDKIDLSKWDTSGWPLSASLPMSSTFVNDFHLTYLDLSCFDFSKIPELRTGSTVCISNTRLLVDLIFGEANNGKFVCSTTNPSIRFDTCNSLSHQSILNIFNLLKSGVTGKTCQIGTDNLNKMTAEEKAIATNKGWTLT